MTVLWVVWRKLLSEFAIKNSWEKFNLPISFSLFGKYFIFLMGLSRVGNREQAQKSGLGCGNREVMTETCCSGSCVLPYSWTWRFLSFPFGGVWLVIFSVPTLAPHCSPPGAQVTPQAPGCLTALVALGLYCAQVLFSSKYSLILLGICFSTWSWIFFSWEISHYNFY